LHLLELGRAIPVELDERVGLTVSKWGILFTMIVFVITLRDRYCTKVLARRRSWDQPALARVETRTSNGFRIVSALPQVRIGNHASAMEILRLGLSPQSLTAAQ